jgi:hypothetical protein
METLLVTTPVTTLPAPSTLPQSRTFDRLAATTQTARLARFIKADVRNRLAWRKANAR